MDRVPAGKLTRTRQMVPSKSRRRTQSRCPAQCAVAWLLMLGLLTAAACALAGCGAASGSGAASSVAASASASPSFGSSPPQADILEAAPVQHVDAGDLSVGYRVIGPLAPHPSTPASAASPGGDSVSPANQPVPVSATPPLLLIMGSSGTMDMWSPGFVAALAQNRHVILFDNRGIGETDNPMGAYPFSQLADDTAGLIKALGYDGVDVLGWSMGGQIAIDLAVRHPETVRHLVSYAGDAGASRAIPPTKAALGALTDTSGSARQRGERLIELLFPAAYRTAHPDYAVSFPIPQEQVSPAAIARQNEAIARWSGVWGKLRDISRPVLFVTGTADVISPARNAAMMADLVPSSWLVRFPGAGHGLMYQEPEHLAAVVLAFLECAQ